MIFDAVVIAVVVINFVLLLDFGCDPAVVSDVNVDRKSAFCSANDDSEFFP